MTDTPDPFTSSASDGLLRSTGPGIWELQVPHRVLGLELGRRLTAVRLPSGELWVHASLPPTPQLRSALAELGSVAAIVGPNRVHDDFLPEFVRAYPQAQFHSAPGLAESNAELPRGTLLDDRAPAWGNMIEQHLVRGMPKLNEVVFFHRPSASLIIADLGFNLRPPKPWLTRVLMTLNGSYDRYGPSRVARGMIADKAAFRASIDHILKWDFRRIVVGHGDDVEQDARSVFRAAYDAIA